MNRRERRKLERQGLKPKAEPTYNLTPSQIIDLSPTLKTTLRNKVAEKLLEEDKRFALDYDAMVIWALHSQLGWGKVRCRRFYFNMFNSRMRMRDFYKMNEAYPERQKLKDKGIDIEAWYNELFDDQGNFKTTEVVV